MDSQNLPIRKIVLFRIPTVPPFLNTSLYYNSAIPLRVNKTIAKQLGIYFSQPSESEKLLIIFLTSNTIQLIESDEEYKIAIKEAVDQQYVLWFIGYKENLEKLKKLLFEVNIGKGALEYYSHSRVDNLYQLSLKEKQWKIHSAYQLASES